jgi:uncharacterized membrane protein YdjX (TVP38/TMEM64 family)
MPASKRTSPKSAAARWIKIALSVVIAAALLYALSRIDLTPVLRWVKDQGVWAPVLFCTLYFLCTVLFIPGSVLTLGGGALFGPLWGSVFVLVGANLGANAAFLLGRSVAREWVRKKVAGQPRFKAIDEAIGEEGWKIVGLLRLSPVIPFNLLNYGLGTTSVSWGHYALASLVGMLPGGFMYVYIGHVIGDAVLTGAAREKTTGEQIALYAGLAATVIVTIVLTLLARQALKKRLDEASSH